MTEGLPTYHLLVMPTVPVLPPALTTEQMGPLARVSRTLGYTSNTAHSISQAILQFPFQLDLLVLKKPRVLIFQSGCNLLVGIMKIYWPCK